MSQRGHLRRLRQKGHWIPARKRDTDPETFIPCPRCDAINRPFCDGCWSCRLYNQLSNQAVAIINGTYYADICPIKK